MKYFLNAITIAVLLGLQAYCADDNAQKKIDAIEKMLRSRNYEAALLLADNLASEEKDMPEAHFKRGYILEKMDKRTDAIKAYDQCVLLLVNLEKIDGSERRLLNKAKKNILRLDKARQIVMQAADELEKKAKSFKNKDEFSYEQIMEVVSGMRGTWAEEPDNKPSSKKLKKEIKQRALDFVKSIATGDLDKSLDFAMPSVRKFLGDDTIKKFLQPLHISMKATKIKASDLRIKEVILGEGHKDAKVIPMYLHHGTKESDPQYWQLVDGKWYIGDEKKLRDFKPEKK